MDNLTVLAARTNPEEGDEGKKGQNQPKPWLTARGTPLNVKRATTKKRKTLALS